MFVCQNKMSWFGSQIEHKGAIFRSSSNPSSSPSLAYNSDYQKQSSGNKISPALLFIFVVIAVVLFISGLFHLLIRFLLKNRSSSPVSESSRYPDLSNSDSFQRQLQQLFLLHDSGLDQAFIDALPVFLYKEIVGLKEPFDCAVCLCEFSEKDKLRLLPMCSHAFHIDCIDTWLLSNSTCPLCRGTLVTPGIPFENPVFHFEETRDEHVLASNGGGGAASIGHKPGEGEMVNSMSRRVFSVRLGKFRSSNVGVVVERVEGETSCSNLDARRCYSMGSFQYVVSELDLQVALLPGKGAGSAVSFKLLNGRSNGQNGNLSTDGDVEGKKLNSRSKGESYSVSKIWQWSKKRKFPYPTETQIGSSANVGLQWNDSRTHGT